MKQHYIIKPLLVSLLTITMIHATNGDTLISVGTKARGMGGAGIAVSHCSESTLHNPALITCTRGTSFSLGGTLFSATIDENIGQAPMHESDVGSSVIPGLSISHKLNENWYLGFGAWGTAGMGVDYSKAKRTARDSGNLHMLTSLQLMEVGVSLAYSTGNFGVALTPILQYGKLQINYTNFDGSNIDQKASDTVGYGLNLGAYYDINGITFGGVYKSKIAMTYDNQISSATQPFVDFGIFPQALSDDLYQPGEIGLGIGYTKGKHTFAFDYKTILWSKAKGYKDFGWKNQNVFALGYQFKDLHWRFRLGYNYAQSPLVEAPSGPQIISAGNYAQSAGNALNLFNLSGFPATSEKHFTLGTGYEFNDNFYVDVAYVYAPKTTTTMHTITGINPKNGDMYIGQSSVEHTESSVSVQFSYRIF